MNLKGSSISINFLGCPRLWPAFLLDGTDTSVMTLVVNALAKKLGLHVFEVLSHDINENVYSHTETKLRNSFFKAKLSAPCIVGMHHFEVLLKSCLF